MKKWLRVLLCIILPVVLLRSFSLLMDTFVDEGTNTPVQMETSNISNALPTVKETVVCDDETAKIVVSGLQENVDSYVVCLTITNKSDNAITYDIEWAKVNGFAMGALPSRIIYAGMNDDADFFFGKDEVRLAQISCITDISFSVKICDKETNKTLSVTNAELHTSAYGQDSRSFSFEGTEVYNTGGISIYIRLSDNPTLDSPLLIYVENNTDNTISVNCNNLAINNKMVVGTTTGPRVPANSKYVSEIHIFFVNDPEIDAVESVTLSLSILPFRLNGSLSTADIFETEPFTISRCE